MRSLKDLIRAGVVSSAVATTLAFGAAEASAAVSLKYFYKYDNSSTCNTSGAYLNGRVIREAGGGQGRAYYVTGWSCRGSGGRELWLWLRPA